MATPNPIHTDDSVQHVDIRIYFGEDVDPQDMLDRISAALQESPHICDVISAYPLVNDGFAHMVPDVRPLA